MSLRERISLVLFFLFCCYGGLEYAAQRWLIYPEFVLQEQQQARDSSKKVRDAINRQFSDFRKQVITPAQSGQLDSILKYNTGNVNTINPVDTADVIVLFDYKWNSGFSRLPEKIPLQQFRSELMEGAKPFLTKDHMGFFKEGICTLNGRFIYLVAEPVLASPQSNKIEGMVLAGRFLSDNKLEQLRRETNLTFNWDILTPDNQEQENVEIISRITIDNPYDFASLGNNFMQCSTALFDHQDRPALLIKTFHDKSISVQGLKAVHKSILIVLLAGFVGVIFVIVLLQIVVISPIMKLIKHIIKLEHPGSAKQKCILSRKDEIGTLAAEFDQMCRRVQNAQVKLMEKSYLSGATEMSSGILHNVRNALSPITTHIDRIKDQFHHIPLDNLEKARTELQNGSLSSQRRADLMRFVELTFQQVMDNLNDTVSGLEDLSGQVIQIEDMLKTQSTFGSKDDKPVEFIEPARLLENAIRMIPEKIKTKKRIQISSMIEELPGIPVHSTTFIQILQNLLINAAESLQRETPLCPKITIDCQIEPQQDSADMLHWRIEDNGIGIDPDKIEAIFERGASSKTTGLTGIGLHWCANTINAMKGRLWAESNGLHKGACFHIIIPAAAEECFAETKEG